jgi:isoquinoline 1-oxidoreductase
MSDKKSSSPIPVEPERYELTAPPSYHFDFDRREFLQVFGGGIVVLIALEEALAAQESGGRRGEPLPEDIGAWLHIDEDGVVTVYTGKVEMGQNIRTSLAQAVAEELGVPIDSIRLVMGDTDLTPYDRGTFGSLTTPTMAPQLRKASATAREILIGLAAERWNVDRKALVVTDGRISDPKAKRSVTFGELTRGQKLAEVMSEDASTTPAERWTIAGRSLPKVGGRDFVTGKHRFTSDLKLADMLYGKVLRPPSFGATLVSLDVTRAEVMADVVVVRDGNFVGVAAPSEERAARAIEAMRAEWKSSPQPSSREIFDYLKAHPAEAQGWRGPRRQTQGSVDAGLAAADKTLAETYTVAYIAHAPMEPRAAVARWTDGKLTVWTGTQRPFGVRSELAETFHLPHDRVHVMMPDAGSGYGGKHTGECAIEAARLAKAAGRPVKLLWTREEEFTWAYVRPAGVIEVKSGVAKDGTLTAWEFHNYNSGASAIEGRYEIPNQHIESSSFILPVHL